MTPKPLTTEELAPFMDQGWRDAYLPLGMEKLLADALWWRARYAEDAFCHFVVEPDTYCKRLHCDVCERIKLAAK